MSSPSRIAPVSVIAYTATTAVGAGKAALREAMQTGRSGLRRNDFGPAPLATWIGRVEGLDDPLPPHLSHWECRNNRLAWLGLNADGFIGQVQSARGRHGAGRVAVVLGTSTSSIGATEEAYRQLDARGEFPGPMRLPALHTLHSLGAFVQEALGLGGLCVTVSTACSSSAKVFAAAERLLRLGLADAVLAGGVDSLCGSTLFGFNALQLVSPEPCQPFDVARRGINIGEAAAYALLERGSGALRLLGYGESVDAHHMSAPHPEGLGARLAVDQALARAGLRAADIDYLHLHGTATPKNDEVEAALVAQHFAGRTHASSTKGLVGHTLGAAGAVGAAVSLLAVEGGWMPGTANSLALDPACGPQIRLHAAQGEVRHVMSNSFGFGGSNCVLVFGRGEPGGLQP